MIAVLAIDPGTTASAWVLFDGERVIDHAIEPNASVVMRIAHTNADAFDCRPVERIVLEQIESFGMAVGREVFETVFWTGRFWQASGYTRVERMPRRAVKLHLCNSARAQDSNIRVALVDRFGGSAAVGTKKAQGPLYGIKSHEWSALAIAVTWWDQNVAVGAQTA